MRPCVPQDQNVLGVWHTGPEWHGAGLGLLGDHGHRAARAFGDAYAAALAVVVVDFVAGGSCLDDRVVWAAAVAVVAAEAVAAGQAAACLEHGGRRVEAAGHL